MALTDLVWLLPAMLVIIGMTAYAGYYILDALNSSQMNVAASAPILESGMSAVGSFDWMFPIITVMLGMGSVVLAYFFPSHPILLVFGVVMFALTFFMVPTMANIFSEFSGSAAMTNVKPHFTFTEAVMSNLPMIISGFGFLMIVVLYSRNRNQGGSE